MTGRPAGSKPAGSDLSLYKNRYLPITPLRLASHPRGRCAFVADEVIEIHDATSA